MITNIEFLGEEPIENVITCMHYKMDKVIFFGYQDVIQVQKTRTAHFLGTYCGVQEVVYQALPENALQTVLEEMRRTIEYELSQGNKIYFDIIFLIIIFSMPCFIVPACNPSFSLIPSGEDISVLLKLFCALSSLVFCLGFHY